MKESPLHPLHAGAGARFAPGTSPELLLTYGDVPGEYAAALGGAVLFDRTELGRVAVSGGDRADFLHRILSSEVRALRPGQGSRSLLLTSKGKVLFDLDLDVEPERILLSCGPGRQEALIEALERYHFAEAVEIADASEGWAPMALAGPARLETLVRVLPGIEAAEGGAAVTADFAGRPVGIASLPVAGSPGLRVDAGPAAAAELWAALPNLDAPHRAVARCASGHCATVTVRPPQPELMSLGAGRFQVAFPTGWPVCRGHFPGAPVVPGAELIRLAAQAAGHPLRSVVRFSFLQPVRPGQVAVVELEGAGAVLGVRVLVDGALVARGQLEVAR